VQTACGDGAFDECAAGRWILTKAGFPFIGNQGPPMAEDLSFVTGASGFVGSHVVRLLRMRGDRVRILMRRTSHPANIEGLGCEIVQGDLRNTDSWERSLQGCRWVFHVAADYRLWARDPREIYESNVGGTRNLLEACRKAGVEKVVYTSTVGTIGRRPDGLPADEETPVALADMIGHYKRSKFMAEQVAYEFARSSLSVVIVNPTAPVGWGDTKPTPTGKVILDFLRGRLPAYVDTGLNVVAVDDVAQGHLLAQRLGKPGERYILGGENMSLKEILRDLAHISGRRAPRMRLPWFVALIAGSLDQFFVGTILRREPSIPLEGVRMARHKMFVNIEKARRELGYNSTPAAEALRGAVDFYRKGPWLASPAGRISKVRAGTA
jgi:dihydroflavonol-4-reductase